MILCVTEQHRPDWEHPQFRYTLGLPMVPESWCKVTIISNARITDVARDALVRKLERLGRLQCQTMPYLLTDLLND